MLFNSKTIILKFIYGIVFYWNNFLKNLIEDGLYSWQLSSRDLFMDPQFPLSTPVPNIDSIKQNYYN